MYETFEIDANKVRDISGEVLGEDGRLKVLPAAYWALTTPEERGLFGVRHGLYQFPTFELVTFLQKVIGDRKAIEIGAGAGILSDALGITGTDSYQQRLPKYRAMYEAMKQPIVPYGPNVVQMDARQAVRQLRPDVVIGCWITHKYDPKRHFAGGNEAGVVLEEIADSVDSLILIGNTKVHKDCPLWSKPHQIIHPKFVYSRAMNGTPDFVAEWSYTGALRASNNIGK